MVAAGFNYIFRGGIYSVTFCHLLVEDSKAYSSFKLQAAYNRTKLLPYRTCVLTSEGP